MYRLYVSKEVLILRINFVIVSNKQINPTISTTVLLPHMYSFILVNIAHLFTKTKKYCMVYVAFQHYVYVFVRPSWLRMLMTVKSGSLLL